MLKLTQSVYFNPREAGASNNGLIVRTNDVVFVDTSEWLKTTEQDLKFVEENIRKPVRFLVNTHFHSDHTFGNQLFDCDIIASHRAPELIKQNEKELPRWLREEKEPETLENLRAVKITYPTILVKDTLRLEDSILMIELTRLGGHTSDSLVVHIPEEKVAFTGDLIFEGSHPFMVGSDIDEWLKALDWLKKSGARLLLPGHGKPCGTKELESMRHYLFQFKTNLKHLKASGTPADEIAKNPHMLQLPKLDKPQRMERNILYQYDKV